MTAKDRELITKVLSEIHDYVADEETTPEQINATLLSLATHIIGSDILAIALSQGIPVDSVKEKICESLETAIERWIANETKESN